MKTENTCIVVTTIQPPTACMHTLAKHALRHDLQWLVIGDRKGPAEFSLEPTELISIEEQRQLPFRLAQLLPEKHYARKNLGYLLAMSRGCERIYETDDDNAPLPHWRPRDLSVSAQRIHGNNGASWVNVYERFTDEHIWPRGLPINQVRRRFDDDFTLLEDFVQIDAPIQQGLANGSPDVDAVWRLVLDREITFDDVPNVVLPAGVWCPFNSQNTWWWKPAFPLMYLPSYCSFRMTDIWRSFVAQRCLWELGYELEFHRADVHQLRNEHDLLRDFDDETVGYLRNDEIRRILDSVLLLSGTDYLKDNMFRCYEALVDAEVVGREELTLVRAWLEDC
ncbi:MAG TPA: STELLO glycosyltransferase family protein [Opitutaceae bacterium]